MLDEFHVTFPSVVLFGVTVAFNFSFVPFFKFNVVLLSFIPVACILFAKTFIVDTLLFPAAVKPCIVTVPAPMPLTFPASSTVAIAGLSDK